MSGGDRDELRQLATQDGVVDLIIPRGGEGLKNALKEHATVPVMYASAGVCHVLVDASADLDDAVAIAVNAKVQRPSVCNAIETLLVHADVAAEFLPRALGELREAGVELRVDDSTRALAGDIGDSLAQATEEDWATEYHALILSVKVVDSLEEGIEHVNRYGTGHSEAIVTGSTGSAQAFTARRRRGRRVRERVDALHRRGGVRHGRRDRQLHTEAARARADRPARADHVQVRRRRLRSGSRVAGLRVGILGGAFNPPHIGHLVCAQEALVQLELDTRRVHPRRRAPHREIQVDPGPEARLRDGRARGRGRRALRGSRIEMDRDGPSYTLDTLEELAKESPKDGLFLILGGDQAAALATWHEPEKVLERATVAVFERRTWGRNAIRIKIGRMPGAGRVRYLDMPLIQVSSSAIRRRVREGVPIRYLVLDKVADYIASHELYSGREAPRGRYPMSAADPTLD